MKMNDCDLRLKELEEKISSMEGEIKDLRLSLKQYRAEAKVAEAKLERLFNRYKQLRNKAADGADSKREQEKGGYKVELDGINKIRRLVRVEKDGTETVVSEMQLLSVDDVAAALDVSTKSVFTYLNDGKLKGTKLKGAWAIMPSDLDAFRKSYRIRAKRPKEKTEE